MIPSLVVGELRAALVEYLASTFALADDDVRQELSSFLEDTGEGIFRGPYLRVRTPFSSVDDDWQWPLQWQHKGFVPHAHQGVAFDRLSSLDHTPEPTLVTTGTGSGKTECFLYPVLDHCARMRAAGNDGIKALILYPMNALASDQAGRLAHLISSEPDLAGIRAGLYVGGSGKHQTMSADHLIDDRDALRAMPPDILLTNYKMLDFLLLRREDRDLWAVNQPDTLQYVVLDEFHSYDGAQGTDVAMLLRRLGRRLGMAGEDGPLGSATPVATSATLGSGASAVESLCGFASKVFGRPFTTDAVVSETRKSVDETCGTDTNYLLPIPDVADLDRAGTDLDGIAAAFCTSLDPEQPTGDVADPVALGRVLLKHPLTRAVLSSVSDRPRTWSEAVREIITRAPNWGAAAMRDPAAVERALARFLWLLSIARTPLGSGARPLLTVDVQIWIREVSRLLRAVDTTPSFRWNDSAPADLDVGPALELPAVYCRRCGMSGWMAVQRENSDRLNTNPRSVYAASLDDARQVRVLLRVSETDPAAQHLDVVSRLVRSEPDETTVPVLVTATEDDARSSRCPGCDERDAIRFLGLRTASLASVSINTLFASPHVAAEQRKVLAFTDSVQDASHRAAFFAGRTHRINLRSLMAAAVAANDRVTLADLGDILVDSAATDRDRFALVPPDLLRHPSVRTVWTDNVDSDGMAVLRRRIAFEVDMEFGLRSRVGRTIELSRAAAVQIELSDADAIADLVAEDLAHHDDLRVDTDTARTYVAGLLDRMRVKGAIVNDLLDPYLLDDGRQWHVWGGRPDGLPPFTPGQGRPIFFTTAAKTDFDSLSAASQTPSWLVDWAGKCLGLEGRQAAEANLRTVALLAAQTDVVRTVQSHKGRVFGLDRHSIVVHDVVDVDDFTPTPASVQCDTCGFRNPAPPHAVDDLLGTPCRRYRCPGRFGPERPRLQNYYRRLYREGATRRVVTGEHTGLLSRHAREALEAAFKSGTAPDAPNVVTATPTLEMGIDIGDLSAVMLTSVPRNPASYAQRVGRAGRASGNALITTFVGTDTHGLYYLSQPEAMLDGDVRPPDCYLDAYDTLCRQFIAYLLDRMADLELTAQPLKGRMGTDMNGALDEGGFLHTAIDAAPDQIESFLDLFGDAIEVSTRDRLREFAQGGVAARLKDADNRFSTQHAQFKSRRTKLTNEINKAEENNLDPDDLRALRGQRAAIERARNDLVNEYTLSGLGRLGLLPNYTLIDDAVTLEATTWWTEGDAYKTETSEYQRSASLAIRELAPGNSFYVAGHRHVVDAVDIGPNAGYETWRLCPECGFGMQEIEATDDHDAVLAPDACPRCDSTGLGDVGTRHRLLRLRRSFSTSSEEGSRVFDENDDRQREAFDVITTVDADPQGISDAWRIVDRTFGAERSAYTRIRTINLGYAQRQGERVPIAGHDRHVTRFTICTTCGAAFEARDDHDGARPNRKHQGWCAKKHLGTDAPNDTVLLYHELVTEAVRMLLPVSLFEVEERLASFTGALLLGLREDFGGEIDHLAVVGSDAPNRDGQGRRRFLVLYDTVPGGTGYLGRLGDPERVRKILEAAKHLLEACPCADEGRAACHRCLLGVVDRREYDLASRQLALDLLDDILTGWKTEWVPTVGDIDLGKVEESELERRFIVALHDWVSKLQREAQEKGDPEPASIKSAPGAQGRSAYELRLQTADGVIRYRIDEQEGLSTTPSTTPDYVFTRQDASSRRVAVYLDGFQFHASPEHNNISADAAKRRGVRLDGHLVWNLTWNDVELFHKAALNEHGAGPQRRPLLTGSARARALDLHHRQGGAIDFKITEQNPFELLLTYLQRPGDSDWARLAQSSVGGAFSTVSPPIPVADADLRTVVEHLASGADLSTAPATDPAAMVGRFESSNGFTLGCVLAKPFDAEPWTAVAALPDAPTDLAHENHRDRWHDWLQWSNVLQFLDFAAGSQAAIGGTSAANELVDTVLLLDAVPTTHDNVVDASPPDEISGDQLDELSYIEDDAVRALVRATLEAGYGPFVAGHELPAGEVLEAAWPDQRVGVVPRAVTVPDIEGWDIRTVGTWSVQSLLDAITNG